MAANLLTRPLTEGTLTSEHLARVQRQREWPIRAIQALQSALQRRLIAPALRASGPLRIPWPLRLFFRIPVLRDLPARLLAFGVTRVRLEEPR